MPEPDTSPRLVTYIKQQYTVTPYHGEKKKCQHVFHLGKSWATTPHGTFLLSPAEGNPRKPEVWCDGCMEKFGTPR